MAVPGAAQKPLTHGGEATKVLAREQSRYGRLEGKMLKRLERGIGQFAYWSGLVDGGGIMAPTLCS